MFRHLRNVIFCCQQTIKCHLTVFTTTVCPRMRIGHNLNIPAAIATLVLYVHKHFLAIHLFTVNSDVGTTVSCKLTVHQCL